MNWKLFLFYNSLLRFHIMQQLNQQEFEECFLESGLVCSQKEKKKQNMEAPYSLSVT